MHDIEGTVLKSTTIVICYYEFA